LPEVAKPASVLLNVLHGFTRQGSQVRILKRPPQQSEESNRLARAVEGLTFKLAETLAPHSPLL